LGSKLISIKSEVFLGSNLGEFENAPLVWSRANFDGFHYTKIARDGYQYLQQAFFPFYPQLISFFQKIFDSFLISSLLISNLSFILLLVGFWKLLELEGIKRGAIKKSLFFLVIFPTSFYFVSAYTESLFLLLVLWSFYFAQKGKFFWAGLLAGFASYTRPIGIFLLPALLVEYYQQESRRKMRERLAALKERIMNPRRNHFAYLLQSRIPHFKNLFFISLSSWGLLKYMYYLKKTQGDWFYFAKVQPDFGAQRSVDKLILLYQVFWRYLKMVFTVYPRQWLYFNVWFELLVSVLFLGLLLWGWYKRKEYKIRPSWLTFATAAYFLPTFTGTFSSMPRYVLVCFPAFLVLARIFADLKKRHGFSRIEWLYLGVSLLLLIVSSAFFFRGYWVA
jgi:hypothetical protein